MNLSKYRQKLETSFQVPRHEDDDEIFSTPTLLSLPFSIAHLLWPGKKSLCVRTYCLLQVIRRASIIRLENSLRLFFMSHSHKFTSFSLVRHTKEEIVFCLHRHGKMCADFVVVFERTLLVLFSEV